jgi:predicted metal-dependent phosphoesterase TrpH
MFIYEPFFLKLMLKSDLHLHCKGDPEDTYIEDTAKEYIDYAAKLGFNVLSFTNHCDVFDIKPLQKYALKKGIVLIPGAEAKIEGKDVLLYNFTKKQVAKIKTFDDLRAVKSKKHLVIAPHPFYPHFEPPFFRNRSLSRIFFENSDLFDALEFCHFYTRHFSFNKKAVLAARQHRLALVGNSDSHSLSHMGTTYSLIDAKPTVQDIINAVKQRKTEVVSIPRSTFSLFKISLGHITRCASKNL